jgi:hypothetical protein
VVPADGHYGVYVTWDADAGHASDAHYRITHPGGVIDRWYDQTEHGSTWQYTDTLWLTAGSSLTVELVGDSSSSAMVSADAVRIGGGMGDVERLGVTSTMPRWQEGAIQYIQFNGAPTSIYDPAGYGYNGSDPSSRSRWAEWEHPASEDAVYLSWHSNATAYGTARGTITYFSGGGSDAPAGYEAACSADAVDGSYSLARAVQDQMALSFQTLWDPTWYDRGLGTACFSEVASSNNNEMPAALVELAFHDNADDALYLKHPAFRRDAARAMYRGIVDYFADRDGVVATYLPEPPTHVSLVHDGTGDLLLTWAAGPAGAPLGDVADHYIVYLSNDGLAWDNGQEVWDLDAAISGAPGMTVYARVAGMNAGGESFPSAIVGARLSPENFAPVLVVDAFYRFDRGMLEWEYAHWSVGDVVRLDPFRINPGDIIRNHGQAIRGAGWFFDSMSDEAAAGVDLSAYDVVVWATGEESTADESVSDAQQVQLEAYWLDGGALWVSGAEVFWDLDNLGSASDQAFAADVLGAGMATDAAGSTDVDGVGVLAGVGPMDFGVAAGAPYPVEWPDTLSSTRAVIANYTSGEVAAVFGASVATFGFPFDAIADSVTRDEVAAALLPALAPGVVPPDVGDSDEPPVIDGGTQTTPDDGTAPGTGDGPSSQPDVYDKPRRGCGCRTGSLPPMGIWWMLGLAAVIRRR